MSDSPGLGAASAAGELVEKPAPDFADVPYGPHERNVLDFWNARVPESGEATTASASPPREGPAPLVVYIHGGGFRAGDKSSLRAPLLTGCLEAGFCVAAINYRLSHQAPYPAFMLDGARAVQFLRSRAGQWGIDPRRVACSGGSAGGGISLWLGFHEDLADPQSEDPVARESTRLSCMAVFNTQSSYDPWFFEEIALGPAAEHPFILPFYGLKSRDEFDTPTARKMFADAAAITHVSAGDPPVALFYSQPNEPLPEGATAKRNDPAFPGDMPPADPLAGRAVHHPRLGEVLKRQMDELGIECILRTETKKDARTDAEMVAFLKRHLK